MTKTTAATRPRREWGALTALDQSTGPSILQSPPSSSSLMFKILLLICNILNITLEKDLNAPPSPLPPFPPQPLPQSPPSPMTSAARSSGNGGGRQRGQKQRQRQGHTTINQQMAVTATKTAFMAVAAVMVAAVAVFVAMAAMAAMTVPAAAQTVAAGTAAREIYIKKGRKRRSW